MIGNRISINVAAATLLVVASCAHDPFAGRGIRFQAHSTGFDGKDTKATSETKTTYGGDSGSTQVIEWSEGDIIRIASDKAYVLDDPERKWSDFKVTSHTEKGAISKASITPATDPNSLQWADGEHDFWAMYPTPTLVSGASFTAGTMVFPMPATQPKTPDMKYAPMLAATTGVTKGAVPLAFYPQYNAFEFRVEKSVYNEINLTRFTLTAETGTIAGTYTVAVGSYNAVASIADADGSQTITVDLTGTTLDSSNSSLTVTVFTIPDAPTIAPGIKGLNGLTIEFQGSFDGENQTRHLTLKDAGGNKLTFAPYKKYRIYGLSFPMLTSFGEEILWDFSALIEQDPILWAMAMGINDDIDWDHNVPSNIPNAEKINWE